MQLFLLKSVTVQAPQFNCDSSTNLDFLLGLFVLFLYCVFIIPITINFDVLKYIKKIFKISIQCIFNVEQHKKTSRGFGLLVHLAFTKWRLYQRTFDIKGTNFTLHDFIFFFFFFFEKEFWCLDLKVFWMYLTLTFYH